MYNIAYIYPPINRALHVSHNMKHETYIMLPAVSYMFPAAG
jgi:hypothetical protein